MTLENWNSVFQVGSAVLLGLTFIFGVGAILTGIAISNRQAALIATTGERVAVADEKAAKASAEAAAANERAGKLELEAAQQRERAARAEKDLVDLQQRVAPRRLSADQSATIVSALRTQPNALHIIRLGDSEAGTFADDLIAALRTAGWNVSVTGIGTMSPPRYGLVYLRGRSTAIPPAVEALRNVLQRAGITMSADDGSGPNGSSALLIGLKP
jgi:hypothetical protein